MKKRAFSFKRDGPLVELMYTEDRKSVSSIAKELGRGYETIKAYLIFKGLYRGPEVAKGGASRVVGDQVDKHKVGQLYFSMRHNSNAKFMGYYKNACRIFIVNELYYAYCKPEELIIRRN